MLKSREEMAKDANRVVTDLEKRGYKDIIIIMDSEEAQNIHKPATMEIAQFLGRLDIAKQTLIRKLF